MLVSNDKALTDNRAVGIEGVGGDLGAIASLDFDRSQLALCQPGEGGGRLYLPHQNFHTVHCLAV